MTQQPLLAADSWPEVAVEAIRKEFPYKRKRADEMASICRALTRLVGGERDAVTMEPREAVQFLRERVLEARRMFAGRPKKFVPHLTTYMNQSRYLREQVEDEVPETLEVCKEILEAYPGISLTTGNLQAYMPILRVIDEHIRYLNATHGAAAASYIRVRVHRFAELVARWPEEEKRYIPGPRKFFEERRYEQDERTWTREPQPRGYMAERDQLRRIL